MSSAVSSTEAGTPSGGSRPKTTMIVLKTVLVATDFGEPSAVALTYGRELARTFGATLRVVHAAANLGGSLGAVPGFVPDFGRLQTGVEESARQRLAALLSEEDRQALHAQAVVVTSMSVADAIVTHAEETRADLIIVGTHGRGLLARFAIGSVAERVVRSAPCPVLVVRHPEHEFVRPDALQTIPSER